MTSTELIEGYSANGVISNEMVRALQDDDQLGKNLVIYFRTHQNRDLRLRCCINLRRYVL